MIVRSFTILLLFVFFSCGLPKDPHDSWENAKKEELKVGVVTNPPFSYVENGGYMGKEIQILKDFAEAENLKIRFRSGNESDMVKDLEGYKIHLLIGGFDKNTIWKKKAGLTMEYNGDNVFLIPKGENELLLHLESYFLNQK